jgi:1,4-alpha-glucan branching enzyme
MTAPSRFGPLPCEQGVTFRLWAPAAKRVDLISGGGRAAAAELGELLREVPVCAFVRR